MRLSFESLLPADLQHMSPAEFEEYFPEAGSIHELERRKGGGGRGGGGRSGGRRNGGSSGGSGGSSSSRNHGYGYGDRKPNRPPVVVHNTGASSRTSTAYGPGGGPITTIPPGAPFAGRTQGGGTRGDIYGSSYYGSGYPSVSNHNRGTAGMPLSFYYWPGSYGTGSGQGSYMYNQEYGNPDNSTRPGGPQMIASFSSESGNTTLHLIADRDSVEDLIPIIREECSGLRSNSSTRPSNYDTNNNKTKPESAIQFYRASTIALLLEGYNNTAALGNDENAPPTPLPDWRNQDLIRCLNGTIGNAAPLIDAAGHRSWTPPSFGLVGLMYLGWCFSALV